jgi:TrmH family RNA methyltransferase
MVCRQKKSSLEMLMENSPDTLLYINGISDPGNLGTILRTAAWFGIKQILINHSCVDPYNTKTVRASAGTIFLVEIYQISERQLFQFAEEKEYKLIATVPHGGTAIDKWKKVGRNIVMFGHESKGLSEETINHADESISIPGHGNVESLNLAVATSIILYEIGKRSKHS